MIHRGAVGELLDPDLTSKDIMHLWGKLLLVERARDAEDVREHVRQGGKSELAAACIHGYASEELFVVELAVVILGKVLRVGLVVVCPMAIFIAPLNLVQYLAPANDRFVHARRVAACRFVHVTHGTLKKPLVIGGKHTTRENCLVRRMLLQHRELDTNIAALPDVPHQIGDIIVLKWENRAVRSTKERLGAENVHLVDDEDARLCCACRLPGRAASRKEFASRLPQVAILLVQHLLAQRIERAVANCLVARFHQPKGVEHVLEIVAVARRKHRRIADTIHLVIIQAERRGKNANDDRFALASGHLRELILQLRVCACAAQQPEDAHDLPIVGAAQLASVYLQVLVTLAKLDQKVHRPPSKDGCKHLGDISFGIINVAFVGIGGSLSLIDEVCQRIFDMFVPIVTILQKLIVLPLEFCIFAPHSIARLRVFLSVELLDFADVALRLLVKVSHCN
mmetsp:Transcript_29379/g.80601  ORF Transcript_29379/g.80601 Transcript_29379/m.80601 type:complete len:454 (-) Transcript_29379:400-1761(-)